MINKSAPITIGRLAKACEVNIETIRHYQRQGLITEPLKPELGFRHYPHETIDRIKFIKRAKKLGFALSEIQQLLMLGSEHCEDVQALAMEKRQLVENQIEGLLTIKSVLDDLICSCQNDSHEAQCAFIDALSQKGFLSN